MHRPFRLPLALPLLLAACASAAAPDPATRTAPPARVLQAGGTTDVRLNNDVSADVTRVAAPAGRAWTVLPAVYGELQIAVGTLDPTRRVIGNTQLSLRRRLAGVPLSRYFDCGSGITAAAYADSYTIQASVLTTVAPAGDAEADVTTSVTATARNLGTSSSPVACSSRGTLERRIAEMLQQRLAAAP